ncbi:MAG: response regulator [Clostridiales bacterium]|jgi:two-component system response regulator YesN|nr:response regulator [Clostridiales bacterium]
MTILLVDDELQLRNYLRTLVDWEGNGYRYMEADNGAAAVEIMKRTPIHLLMLDITMPVMSGLEVLAWIKENQYDCVTAILTSHDELSYAQKSLRLGCRDYILKSDITGETILALADRLRGELSAEIRQQQRYAAMETAARRKEMIEIQYAVNYWLKNGGERGGTEITPHFEKTLGFPDGESRYVMLRIQLRDYGAVVNRYADSDAARFSVVFERMLNELLNGNRFFYTECDAGEFLVFLRFSHKESTHGILNKTQEMTKQMGRNLTGRLGIRSGIVFTLPYTGIASSIERYGKFKQLRAFSFWNPADEILCLDDYIFDEQICAKELNLFSEELTREMKSRSIPRIESAFDKMAERIMERRYCVNPMSFKNACISCVTVFLMSQAREPQDIQAFFLIEDIETFKTAMLELIRPYCISEKDQDKNRLVKKAFLLIQQHYSEDIGLDWLSSKLYVNASYLSRVFSAETGQPITAYINAYRIEQAKRFIRSENMKLYEIAEKTGFSSSVVFSSVFKKITGETPSDYRNRNV